MNVRRPRSPFLRPTLARFPAGGQCPRGDRLLLAVDVWYLVAAPVAWAVGALNGYVFNSRWTFAARDTTRARSLYALVTTAGAGASSLLVWLFAAAGLGKMEAFIATIPLVTVATFLANRIWTFSEREA